MGHHLSVVEFPQCLLLEIEGSKGVKPEKLLLVPLTPQTVPKPQSPLLRILLEAEYENTARQWAWPPVSNPEDPNGPSDIRSEALYSGLDRTKFLEPAPTLAQCYQHAVAKERRQPSYSRRYGHLFSILAVVVPESVVLPTQRTSWIPWSAALMQELLDNKATAAGLYRYHHFQNGNLSSGSFAGSPTASLDMSFGAAAAANLEGSFCAQPIDAGRTTAAVDYYLFRDFCYEAKATILLQAAAYFIENYPPVGSAPAPTKAPAPFSGHTLLRCRAANVPQVRLMQKLVRLHLAPATLSEPLSLFRYGDNDEVLHCKITPAAREELRAAFLSVVKISPDGKCSLPRDCVMASGVITPFDPVISQSKDVWARENAPVKATAPEVPPASIFREQSVPHTRSLSDLAVGGPYFAATAAHRSPNGTPVSMESPGALENQSFAACSDMGMGENSSFAFPPSYTVQSSQGPSLVASFVTAPPEYLALRLSGSPQPEDVSVNRHIHSSPGQQLLLSDRGTAILPPKTGVAQPQTQIRGRTYAQSPKPAVLEDSTVFLTPNTPVLLSHGDGEWHSAYWRNEAHPTSLYKNEDGWVQLVVYGEVFVWDSETRPMVMPAAPSGRPTYVAVDPRTSAYSSDPSLPLTPCGELFALWGRNL